MLELELIARSRQEDMQREVEQTQIMREVAWPQSPLQQAVTRFSRSLIRLGEWLIHQMGKRPPIRKGDKLAWDGTNE
ncbi:MAG: hypothetical protein ACE5JF_11200 [Anaerolineales bacterium]